MNDTTLPLHEKLIQHQVEFDIALHRAHEDAERQGVKLLSQQLRWMHEDYAKETERILQDDYTAQPDTWERVGVWSVDEPEVRAAINGMRQSGYYYTEMYGRNVDTHEQVIMLYRKAVSNE